MRNDTLVARSIAGIVLLAVAPASGCFVYCPLAASAGCLEPNEIHADARAGRAARVVVRLGDERSWVREEAADALGVFPGASDHAFDRLAEVALDASEEDYVRAAAVRSLARIGDPRALPRLAGLATRSVPPELGLALIDALCDLGGEDARAAVEPLEAHEDLLVSALARKRIGGGCAR